MPDVQGKGADYELLTVAEVRGPRFEVKHGARLGSRASHLAAGNERCEIRSNIP